MNPDGETLPFPEPDAQPASSGRSRIYYGWLLLAAAILVSSAASGANSGISIATILSLSMTLGLSSLALGGLLAIGVLTNGFTQPILGYLFDRYDSRRVICISVAVAGLATAGLGLIPSYSYFVFLFGVVSAALGGASFGLLGPLVARWFLKRRLLALGLLMAGPAMVNIVLTEPITAYVLVLYDWRLALIALGAVLLFLALPLGLKFLRNWPSDMGLKPDGDPESPTESRMRGSAPISQLGRFEVERWWRAFRSPPIWALLPVFAVAGFTSEATPTLFDSLAVDVYAVGPQWRTVMHAVMEVSGLIGAVVVGLIADRFPRKKLLGALLLAGGLAFLVSIASPWYLGLLLASVLIGLSGTAWMVVALSLIADVYGLRALATLWGIVFLFGSIGKVIVGVIGGLTIVLSGSYYLSFPVCALMLVLASIVVFRINERKYSARYQAAVGVDAVDN